MEEKTANIIIEHLRALRDGQKALAAKLDDHDKRFSFVERQLASIRGDIAVTHEMQVDSTDSIRNIIKRVERLERHADLTDTLPG